MQKPNGYDEAQAGNFVKAELGGHYAVIKQVAERQSSTGKNMIVVLFDFAEADKQGGYFSDLFKNDTRDERKWPFAGSKYIMVQDYNDPTKTSRNFKSFCTCVEGSNNFSINWNAGDAWGKQFSGKKIGVVFGDEEQEYDGRITMRRIPKWFCTWDAVKDARIPDPKYLNGSGPAARATTNTAQNDSFMQIPNGVEDEIPF